MTLRSWMGKNNNGFKVDGGSTGGLFTAVGVAGVSTGSAELTSLLAVTGLVKYTLDMYSSLENGRGFIHSAVDYVGDKMDKRKERAQVRATYV